MRLLYLLIVSVALVRLAGAAPAASDPADWPDWASEEDQLRQRIEQVNEGELRFIQDPVADAIHRHDSRITINAQSLVDGWVGLEQCHDNLDRVQAAQIVFNPTRSRALQVVGYRNMDSAFIEGSTVQLRGIRAASEVCLRLHSRALHRLAAGVYELQNGPFMRRFLDGYYPLQLSLRIDHPPSMTLADHVPAVQPGFAVRQTAGRVQVDTIFEGELHTVFRFIAD